MPKISRHSYDIAVAAVRRDHTSGVSVLKVYRPWFYLQDKSKDSKANPLSVKNIGGVFVVLLVGLAASIIVAVLEFCWNSRKNSQIDHQSLCSG